MTLQQLKYMVTIAEKGRKQKETYFRDLVFGLLDCSMAMLFFLPFFGQNTDGMIQEVSLLSLTEPALYLRLSYYAVTVGIITSGLLTVSLQNYHHAFWLRSKYKISLILNAVGALLFIMSLQPYAAIFLFVVLIIKVLLLIKW